MLEGTDLKLAVALKKSGKVDWSVIQEGESALDRGQAKSLKEWLADQGHLEPYEVEAILGGPASSSRPEPEEPAADPDRVVVSSPAELLALLQQRKQAAEKPAPAAAGTETGIGIARTPRFGASSASADEEDEEADDDDAAPKRKFGGSKSFGETFGTI